MLGRGLLLFIGCFCKVYVVLPPFRVVRKGFFFYLCGRRPLEPAVFYLVWRQVITLRSIMSIICVSVMRFTSSHLYTTHSVSNFTPVGKKIFICM